MVKQAPVLIAKLCESIKDDKSKLENFLKKDLRPMLKELLNVDDSTVDNLIKLGIVENLNADNIEELLLSGLNFLRSIEPQELKILTEALVAHVNGQELSDEQMKVLNKYDVRLIYEDERPVFFNPEYDEAITSIPTNDSKLDNSIHEVYQKGFFYKDKVLRYEKVIVNKYNEE